MGDNFAENLRNARIAAKLSQKEVAERVGVAKSTYSLYEAGKRRPVIAGIKALADALGVTADELLGLPPQEKENELYRPAIQELLAAAVGNDDEDIEMAAATLRRIKMYRDLLEANHVQSNPE